MEGGVKSLVYGLKHRPRHKVVYVGSTVRDNVRWGEHINLTSGCRRVAIALSRKEVQPVLDFYELDVLWEGFCTSSQLKAIEQIFMVKHDTRVHPRPTNGVTKDIDLFDTDHPDQLNVMRSCTDEALLHWARLRIQRDSAITVQRTPTEERRLTHELEELIWEVRDKAESLACNKVRKWVETFDKMDLDQEINVNDIHVAFNDVFIALDDDDGLDVKRIVQCNLKWFNTDTRSSHSYSVQTIVTLFRMMATMIGAPTNDQHRRIIAPRTGPTQQVQLIRHDDDDATVEQVKADLMGRVVSTLCTEDRDAILRPVDVALQMKAFCTPIIWAAIGGPPVDELKSGAADKGFWAREMHLSFANELGQAWVDKERQYNGVRVKGRHIRGIRFAEVTE